MSDTVQVFLLVLASSFVFTVALSRVPLLRIPSSIGYLIFGVLLQIQSIPLTVDELRWIHNLGNFGLLYLMFLSGMEVDISALRPNQWKTEETNPLKLASAVFLASLLISFLASVTIIHVLKQDAHPYMLTLLLATTSLGVILPILEETNTLHTAYGQTLLLCALLADLCTMLLVSLFIATRTATSPVQFLCTLAIIPAGLCAWLILRRIKSWPGIRSFAGDAQNRTRGAIALLALGCAFAAYTGSEPILGSFLAGITLAAIPFAFQSKFRDYCHGIGYGLLVPLFFISVGLNFHFAAFRNPSTWMWVPTLLIAAYSVKFIPALQLRRAFGWRFAAAGGCLLSSRLSLVVAAAEIGVRIGALPDAIAEAIILVAIITCLTAPILFSALMSEAS